MGGCDYAADIVSGFDADAIIEAGVVENVLALRNEAIKKDEEDNYYVYLIDANNKTEKKIVEIGLSDGYKTQILSDLEIRDNVVSNPTMEIKDGVDVIIKE